MSDKDSKGLPAGEPPATPTEDHLGRFLDEAMTLLGRGQSVNVAELLPDRPDLVERGQRLVEGLQAFRRSAPVPDTSVSESPATIYTPLTSPVPCADAGTFPDPFPGEFCIRKQLGEGTFGKVWLADDLHLGRQVALKTLHLPADADPSALEALRKEANFLAGIHHPHVVQVHAWRQSGGEHYLVLEYVAGGSLADLLKKEGPLPWQRAGRYMADVAEGLLEVHRQHIVHRDIKASNTLWDSTRDEAKLADFGVAGRLGATRTVAGTPVFMAPEAFQGRATEASDVYGLAATLFHLVTGELPFSGATWDEVTVKVERGLPEVESRFGQVPQRLERVIRAGLAAAANDRPSLPEFIGMLRGALNQTLVDALVTAQTEGTASVDLRLEISRKVGTEWRRVATTHPQADTLRRDIRRVPPMPAQTHVRTGEPLRLEVVAERAGYLTVWNVGPTGNLNLLYPVAEFGDSPTVAAGKRVCFDNLMLDGPAGRERMFAVWSSKELPVSERELRSLAGDETGGMSGSRAYRSSRDIVRVRQAVEKAGAAECRIVVVELEHAAGL